MPSTKKKKRPKPQKRKAETCTRCLKGTLDWYPTTGGAKLKFIRCSDCYESEVLRATREDLPYDIVRTLERKETLLK
jgi:hypothetical protein